MKKENLEKIAKEAKLATEHKTGEKGRPVGEKGRPVGAKGALPAIKTMVKADLMREVGQSRKKIKDLETKVSELSQGPKEDQIPPEMWAVFPSLVYDYMSTRFGPHWKLSEDEVLLYGQNLQKVADRYLGTVAGDNPELFGLAIVVVSTAVPRVLTTFKQRKEKQIDASPGKDKNRNHNRPGAKGVGEK